MIHLAKVSSDSTGFVRATLGTACGVPFRDLQLGDDYWIPPEGNQFPSPVTCPDCLAGRRVPMSSNDPRALRIVTVYAHPRNFPNEVVARESFTDATGERKGEIVARGPDLESCRAAIIALDLGLVCLARHPEDDPMIVETWI